MGQGLEFLAGEGPKMRPTLLEVELHSFTPAYERCEPIYETVRRTRAMISDQVTMLGFAGSPWTVATYMIAGEGSKDQGAARLLAYRDPARMQTICDAITEVSVAYLRGQIDAGDVCPVVVLADERMAGLPDTPTANELGVPVSFSTVRGFVVHKDTPDDVAEKIEAALLKSMNHTVYQGFLTSVGLDSTSVVGSDVWGAQLASMTSDMESALKELGFLK